MKVDVRAVLLVLFLLGSLPLSAHHGYDGFDRTTLVTLSGTITKTEWINPHAFVHLVARADDGTETAWLIELSPPRMLQRMGVGQGLFREGTRLVVDGYAAAAGGNRVAGRFVTLADGRRIELPDQGGFSRNGRDLVFTRDGIVIRPDPQAPSGR